MSESQQPCIFPDDPLKKSISILFIDDEVRQLEYYRDIVSGHALYSVQTASSAQEAQSIIASTTNRPHLCMMDLGIDDIGNDEFYLLKKFSNRVPFIIVSGSMDMERAFEASKHEAAAMIAKPAQMTSEKFWGILSSVFLDYAIYPNLNRESSSILQFCRDVLHNKDPESVTEWAALAAISDTYLRKIWAECFTYPPKLVLFLYKMYKYSFEHHNAEYIAELNGVFPSPCTSSLVAQYKQMIKYYLQNKNELDMIRNK
jgi:CheY-like chemotaxis protein